MKVIGAGFGRTGTTSLKAALEELGFGPAYHLTEAFEHPEHVDFWEGARRGERVDWQTFFSGYGVAVDWPSCAFYEELMEAFPDAKTVLTVRDPHRWYESVRNTIFVVHRISSGPLPLRLPLSLLGLFAPGIAGIVRLADDVVWHDTFRDRFEDRRHAIEAFERHNEAVRHRIPPDRLLVFDVKEGWAPLCDFLGVEAPEEPFPHLNNTREMRRRLLGLAAASAATPTLVVAGLFAIQALLLRRVRHRTKSFAAPR